MRIELGSIWTVTTPRGEVVVVLSGPFGRDEAPEFIVAPLYGPDSPGRAAPDVVPLEVGGATRYAALWNTRPASAADLEHQLGRLTGQDSDSLSQSYWSWLEDDAQNALKDFKNPLNRRRIRKFRESEVERWSLLSGAALSRRHAVEPGPSPEKSVVPAGQPSGWEEVLSKLSVKISGPEHLSRWTAAVDMDLAFYIRQATLDLGEEVISSIPHVFAGPNRVMFFGMLSGQEDCEMPRLQRAVAETTDFLQGWGAGAVGTMIRDSGVINVDDKSQGAGQQSPVAGNRLTRILEPS